jgi:GATA-binding protein, other eukaryote
VSPITIVCRPSSRERKQLHQCSVALPCLRCASPGSTALCPAAPARLRSQCAPVCYPRPLRPPPPPLPAMASLHHDAPRPPRRSLARPGAAAAAAARALAHPQASRCPPIAAHQRPDSLHSSVVTDSSSPSSSSSLTSHWSPASSAAAVSPPFTTLPSASLGLSPPHDRIRAALLSTKASCFPSLQNDASRLGSTTQLSAQDPLLTQVWALYRNTKLQLPNAERMQNFIWRYQSIRLSSLLQDSTAGRYVATRALTLDALTCAAHSIPPATPPAPSPASIPDTPPQTTSAPSISQPTHASDQHSPTRHSLSSVAGDPMNLDDFLVPNSVASPAGLSPSPSGEKMISSSTAIPIRRSFAADTSLLSQTAPISAPIRRDSEFAYLQRHVRKTSIDERRVSFCRLLDHQTDTLQGAKRRADASPQVPPVTGSMLPTDAMTEAVLNSYSLDRPELSNAFHQHTLSQPPNVPFSLDTVNLDHHDPIVHSAGPFQNQFHFSPATSPQMSYPGANMYSGASLGSSLGSAADLYSPSGSAYQSTVSTPQPIPEGDQLYFDRPMVDMRQQAIQNINSQRSSLSMMMPSQYIFSSNADGMMNAVSTAAAMGQFPAPTFDHVNPNQVLNSEYVASRQNSLPSASDNGLFLFGDSDENEDDDGGAFADRTLPLSPMDDPMDMGNSVPWENNLSSQYNAARYPMGTPKKSVTIGGAEMMSSPTEYNGSTLNRTFGSAASVSELRNRTNDPRRQKIPRTSSTPNAAALVQTHMMHHHRARSSPNSPPESGFSSAAPSRPDSPGKGVGGDGGAPTTCTNCFTQTTPLWRRNPDGQPLCNACGLFLKLHGVVRPLSLKTDVIKKRNRGSNNTAATGSGTRSKKSSRKNSIAHAQAIPPLTVSRQAGSQADSESPKSTSSAGGMSGSMILQKSSNPKGGVIPIAPAPKHQSSQSASSGVSSRGATSSGSSSGRRTRRQSKVDSQDFEPFADMDDSIKLANGIKVEPMSGKSSLSSSGLGSMFPGALGQVQTTTTPPVEQQWEWLTMSL